MAHCRGDRTASRESQALLEALNRVYEEVSPTPEEKRHDAS